MTAEVIYPQEFKIENNCQTPKSYMVLSEALMDSSRDFAQVAIESCMLNIVFYNDRILRISNKDGLTFVTMKDPEIPNKVSVENADNIPETAGLLNLMVKYEAMFREQVPELHYQTDPIPSPSTSPISPTSERNLR